MKYFIKIIRDSIRQNLNAGKTKFNIINNIDIVGKDKYGNRKYFKSEEEVMKAFQNGDIVKYEINKNIENVYTIFPDPCYLFVYEDKQIQCNYCKAKFNHKDLKADCFGAWGEGYSNIVCPMCGGWDCVNIEYEDIDKVIKQIQFQKE